MFCQNTNTTVWNSCGGKEHAKWIQKHHLTSRNRLWIAHFAKLGWVSSLDRSKEDSPHRSWRITTFTTFTVVNLFNSAAGRLDSNEFPRVDVIFDGFQPFSDVQITHDILLCVNSEEFNWTYWWGKWPHVHCTFEASCSQPGRSTRHTLRETGANSQHKSPMCWEADRPQNFGCL